MPSLLRHPLARFVTATALVGSFADWVLFATLVVTVDTLIGGGPWATAVVLLVRIVPGVVFAPVAARRVDGGDLRRTLVRHEALRIASVTTLVAGFSLGAGPLILTGLLGLEFAAAMQAAARESTISRHVPADVFTPLNTATAVLGYGLLPLGPIVVATLGPTAGWAIALAGYAVLALGYRALLPLDPDATATMPVDPAHRTAEDRHASTTPASWRRVTVAAALGVLPAVALFALGPTFAIAFLGDRTATGPLYAAVLAGGAMGFALANLGRLRADVAMLVAAAGLGLAATGVWLPGLALLGVGAGAAYLDLQTRLQHAASDPSEFAAAFAILKIASAAAVAGSPLLATVAPVEAVLLVGAVSAGVGAAVAAPSPTRAAQRGLRAVLRLLAHCVLRVEVVDSHRRVVGPAVVVSNHPHWLDGVVALLVDESLRPVARRQRHLGARLGIWAADAVVTTRPAVPVEGDPTGARRPAFAEAAAHLRAGGRVWLAPEGGSHTARRLRPPRSGAVRMANQAAAPVQPLAISWHDDPAGPHLHRWRPWRRRVVRVTWGAPLVTTGDVEADNARMMAALAMVAGMQAPDPALAVAA